MAALNSAEILAGVDPQGVVAIERVLWRVRRRRRRWVATELTEEDFQELAAAGAVVTDVTETRSSLRVVLTAEHARLVVTLAPSEVHHLPESAARSLLELAHRQAKQGRDVGDEFAAAVLSRVTDRRALAPFFSSRSQAWRRAALDRAGRRKEGCSSSRRRRNSVRTVRRR